MLRRVFCFLLRLAQRFGIGAFDADEHADEIGLVHQPQQFGIVRQIDRRFGGELERIVVLFEPRSQMRKKGLHGLLVADQVVVHEVDMAAIAKLVEPVELGQHLRRRLGARHAAIELDDVAELAGERTAARELHADIEIIVELQQIEARDRRLGHVDREFGRLEDAFARARIPGGDEVVDDGFGLAENWKLALANAMGTEVTPGPPIATGLPRARHMSMISTRSGCCGSMPPVITRSAQSRSLVLAVLRCCGRPAGRSSAAAAARQR